MIFSAVKVRSFVSDTSPQLTDMHVRQIISTRCDFPTACFINCDKSFCCWKKKTKVESILGNFCVVFICNNVWRWWNKQVWERNFFFVPQGWAKLNFITRRRRKIYVTFIEHIRFASKLKMKHLNCISRHINAPVMERSYDVCAAILEGRWELIKVRVNKCRRSLKSFCFSCEFRKIACLWQRFKQSNSAWKS